MTPSNINSIMRKEIQNHILNFEDINTNFSHPDRERYLRFVSNTKACKIKVDSHLDMFKKLMISEYLNSYLSKTYDSHIIKLIGSNANQPQIYTTIHLGAYKLIVGELLKNGINLCIPISKRVYNEQFDDFMNLKEQAHSCKGSIDFVDIEERSGIFKMIKYIKQGYSLLMYLDGNSGIGGMERVDDKLTSVDFFNKKIMGRKGIAFIANALNLSIQPIVSFFDEDNVTPNIHFLDIIPYIKTDDKKLYEKDLIQNLWSIFCKYINQYPDQWEGWLYVDAFFDKKIKAKTYSKTQELLTFNYEKYDFISKNEDYYLYDMENNILVKTSKGLFSLFHTIYSKKIILNTADLNVLIKKQTLIDDILSKAILTN